MNQIAVEYFSKILSREDLSANERLSFQAQWQEAQKKLTDGIYSGSIESEREYHNKGLATLKQFYVDGSISKEAYDSYIEQMEIEHWQYMAQIAADGSAEKQEAEDKVADIQIKAMERRRKEAEALEKEFAGMKQTYFGDNEGEKQEKYSNESSMLDIVYAREIEAAGDSVSERLRIEEAYEAAKLALKQKYWGEEQQGYSNSVEEAVMKSLDWLNSDGGKALTGTMDTLVSGMSSVFSQLSSLIQADLEVQTASIEKKYNREIELAEGNSYKVRQLEKKKEAELAKVKAEANRKMFAQQVIQAVAQTATNALNAFGSAAAIPVVGYVLAPIAAAMAIAAGAVQIAAIKKQQQASEATGYASGGFTPKGPKDKPVGIVHAGEWVASQALVNNPGVRPVLDALDYAQRNNRVGSITGADISGAVVTPPAARVASLAKAPTVVVNTPTAQQPQKELTSVMERLDSRLNEPFITINTVEGDRGMKRSLDEHTSLVNRAKPRYQR